jgi:hypothetical protein
MTGPLFLTSLVGGNWGRTAICTRHGKASSGRTAYSLTGLRAPDSTFYEVEHCLSAHAVRVEIE